MEARVAVSIYPDVRDSSSMTPHAALRAAWVAYLAMLFVPFAVFVAVFSWLNFFDSSPAHQAMRSQWLVAPIVFMIAFGPIMFGIRGRMFHGYYRGQPVTPAHYLLGMILVWSVFEIGGIMSLVGCLACNSMTPCLMPAIAAFFFFTPMWPNGRAMARPTGHFDDPEIYREPR